MPALIDGEFTIKRYCLVAGGGIVLVAENQRFMDIEISAETGLEVWGVVKRPPLAGLHDDRGAAAAGWIELQTVHQAE